MMNPPRILRGMCISKPAFGGSGIWLKGASSLADDTFLNRVLREVSVRLWAPLRAIASRLTREELVGTWSVRG